MIAIIDASGSHPGVYGLDAHQPMALFPLGDRPILHHVVDWLTSQGVRRFEFVLGHLPEKIESYLGDGARWGCSFGYHLPASATGIFELAAMIADGADEPVVLGRGDRFPEVDLKAVAAPTLFVAPSGDWTGWAIAPPAPKLLAGLGQDAAGQPVVRDDSFVKVTVPREASFETAAQLLASQGDLLAGLFTASAIGDREREPAIWISRNVSLDPTVTLRAPLYIGPNCKIEKGVRIGPSAVIGEGCIVDEQSSVVNALVAPRTYIGQGLELEDVIVDRNRLVNAKIGTSCLISESFLLSGLARRRRRRPLQRLVSGAAALVLLLCTLPMAFLTLLFLLLGRKGELRRTGAVRLPASDDPRTWREHRYLRVRLPAATVSGWWVEFVAEVWPGLLSVIKGDMFLVGVKPRSGGEIERLSSDWRSIYLNSKAGLITEAVVMFGKSPTADELYTAEAYYSATEGIGRDLKLLRLYLSRLVSSNERVAAGPNADAALRSPVENAPERR